MKHILFVGVLISFSSGVLAKISDAIDATFMLELEQRFFFEEGELGQSKYPNSVAFFPEINIQLSDDANKIVLQPYIRIDSENSSRSHIELKQAYWEFYHQAFMMRLGYEQVHWGKAEFLNIVDSVNQHDYIELNPDAKLGQPMLHLSYENITGIWDAYFLFGYQESRFPKQDERPNLPITVDGNKPIYLDDDEHSVGYALRWSKDITTNFSLGLSYFDAIDREPNFSFNFDFNDPKLVPLYANATQFGLEAEYLYKAWTLKLEAIKKKNLFDDFFSAVAGVEYSIDNLFDLGLDARFIFEYLWSDRKDRYFTIFDDDLAAGIQLSFNDVQTTQWQLGFLMDRQSHEKVAYTKLERRLFENFKMSLDALTVVDKGRPDVGETVLEIANDLNNKEIVALTLDDDVLLNLFLTLLREEGLLYLLFDFNSDPFIVQPLQNIQRLLSENRKFNLFERENVVRLTLEYYF